MKNLALALAVLLAATTPIAADVALVNLTLDTPSSTVNTLQSKLLLEAGIFGENQYDTAPVTISGTSKINLGIVADPVTNEVTSVSTLEMLYELGVGPVKLQDMSFYIDLYPDEPDTYYITANSANIASTFKQAHGGSHYVQGPPSTVTNGKYNLADQELYCDHGTFVMDGTYLELIEMNHPILWDLSITTPSPGAAYFDMKGTGSVNVSLQDIVGDQATYDVELLMPVAMEVRLWTTTGVRMGALSAAGNIAMHGEMTRTVVVPPTLLGDANNDGFVDNTDAAILATNWHHSGAWAQGDFNDDDVVDDKDASILAAHWTGPHAEGQAEVPEPSTLVGLIGLALAGAFAWRRR